MKQINVSVDFDNITGKWKPMHGVGQPPLLGFSDKLFPYLTRAGIPYSRLHDVGGPMGLGHYVDIPNLFRDFDADENDPASYDFAFTDTLIEGLVRAGVEPYFRLGVTIEVWHRIKAYRIFPPKDFEKWARICEHVVAHYIDGWANGFHFPISYWEIWNEPDDGYREETGAMWRGTPEEYFKLYEVTAKHLKGIFGDRIKVGGYGACGMYEYRKDEGRNGEIEVNDMFTHVIWFMHHFLAYQKEAGAPLDFYSWHLYDSYLHGGIDFLEVRDHALYVRETLDQYGFYSAESHLNEWNIYCFLDRRDAPRGASRTLALMLMMQDTSTDLMCYYDAGLAASQYKSFLNPDNLHPYRTYYAFPMFHSLYRLENECAVEVGDPMLFVGAAKNGSRASVVIANTTGETMDIALSLVGFDADEVLIHRIDEENRYTETHEALGSCITVPADGCVEISLYKLA